MDRDVMPETDEYPQAVASPEVPAPAVVRVDLGARTHPGKVRANNEDNFHVVQFGRHLRTLLSSLPDGQVPAESGLIGYGMIVADGMGGMAAGEVASRLAITLLVEHALGTPDWILELEEPYTTEALDRAARRFQHVNEAIVERADRGPGLRGMGTTLSLAMSLGRDLILAHVGDSPILLARRGTLHRLTRDHTLGQQMALRGASNAERFRHVLTRAIGIPGTGGDPDLRHYRLDDGDRLLLCTDGLTDMVDEEAIARELARDSTADDVCRALIELALESGGRDNVTAVVVGYRMGEESPPAG
jgi:serine/threonine protein phosphatase PrpC